MKVKLFKHTKEISENIFDIKIFSLHLHPKSKTRRWLSGKQERYLRTFEEAVESHK